MPLAGGFAPLPQVTSHELLVFLMQIGLLLLTALLLGRLAVKLTLPAVTGELLAGVLLGPTILGHLWPGASHWLFPINAAQAHMTDAVAQIGLMLLVGLTGAQLDLRQFRGNRGAAVSVSLSGLVLPLALGIGVGLVLPASLLSGATDRRTFAVFLGVAMCVSAIPVIAKTLMDMNLMHRNVGQLTIASGMVDDAVGWFLLSVVAAMAAGAVHGWEIARTVGELLLLLVAAAVIGRPLVRAAFRLANRSADNGPAVATAVLVILGGATVTHSLGLEPVFGAFIGGVLIGAPGKTEAVSPVRLASLRTFVMWVGAPIFLATAGLRMDLTVLGNATVLAAAAVVVSVAIVGKFAGAYFGGWMSRLPIRERLAIGAGMNARGVVEVVVALAGLRLGVLTTTTYTIIVLVALVTSLMAPPLLRLAMRGIDHTAEERERELLHARWAGPPMPAQPEPSVAGHL